jgi:hexosaminidase
MRHAATVRGAIGRLHAAGLVLATACLLAACGAGNGADPGAADAASSAADPAAAVGAADPIPVLPLPASVVRGQGTVQVGAETRVVAAGDPAAREAAAAFVGMLAESSGATLPLSEQGEAGKDTISFALDPNAGMAAEGYVLEIGAEGIRIRAGDAAGLFYGGVSLWQLLSASPEAKLPVQLAALRIEDAPRFAWRGFMLDSARHIQSVDRIKALLDQMARHKLNTFHWHLTDDQGWRLQIKQYPKLTDVGAWRTPAGKAGVGADGKLARYGGFYTQDQAREIVDYARKLHITVVPEIELPGHAQAAIAAYPQLGASGKTPPVSPDWGVHTWLFNTEDETFEFLQNVLTEVMDIFPGQYIHIGGDEADKYQWRNSAQVQAKRKALGLKDDLALQSWFIKRIETFLVAHDRRLIGWDEILEGGLPPEATVMSWRGTKGAVEAAREGHDVVLSPSNVTYLNRMQSEEADEPPGHDYPTPLKAVYDFEPVPVELDAAQAKHVLGAQGNLWTEHVRTEDRVEHMAFPRLSALAEVTWSPKATRDFSSFLTRLAPQMRRFARAGMGAADSAFAVRYALAAQGADRAQVTLANQTGFGELRYTTDGSAPTAQSPKYTQPLDVSLPSTLQANAFLDGQPLAQPRTQVVDAVALRSRSAEQLAPCREGGLEIRLEDDEPAGDARAVLPVDIGNPCWSWAQAPLEGMAVLHAEVVDLPFNFQFGGDSAGPPPPAPTALPQLQVFANRCEGTPLATQQLTAQSQPVKTIDVALPKQSGATDLCLKFSGEHRHTLWAIERLELRPAAVAQP